MSLHSGNIIMIPNQTVVTLTSKHYVLIGEVTNANFIAFWLARLGLEPTIYGTRGEQTNHYTTNGVSDNVIQLERRV